MWDKSKTLKIHHHITPWAPSFLFSNTESLLILVLHVFLRFLVVLSKRKEPGRLQSMGLLRVGHDWATSLSLFTFMHWRRKWQPTPCLENPRDGGAWWVAVYGAAQSWTPLKRLRSSSSKRNRENYVYFIFWSRSGIHFLNVKMTLAFRMMLDLWKEENPEGTLLLLIQVTSRTIYGGTWRKRLKV